METHPVFLTKKFSVTVIILAVSLFSGRVLAYDQNETHPALTRYIGEFYNKVNPQNPLSREDVGSLAQGSVAEDNNARFIYHFYDPVNQKGLWGRNLSSRDWSQDIQAQAKLFGLAGAPMGDSTNQTWERAIFEHVKGNRQAAMYALGHVLHLIEDATVPEHVRNDAHTGAPGDPKSPFENWAKGERLTELSATVRGLSERVPSFGSLNEVFDETALYTNRNFFSEQTIGFGRGYILPDIQFFGKDEEAKNYFVAYGVEPGGELYRLAAKRTFVDDRQEWDQIEEPKFPSGFSLEHGIVMQDYWPRLSKKAIVNGAATIDLFFREAEKYKQNPELMAGWNKQSWMARVFSSILSNFVPKRLTPSGQSSGDKKSVSRSEAGPVFEERRGLNADAGGEAVAPSRRESSPVFRETVFDVPQTADVSRTAPTISSSPSPIVLPSPSTTLRTYSPSPVAIALPVSPTPSPHVPSPSPAVPSPSLEPTPLPKLLISEVQIYGASADDEFVELYNPNDFPADLTGWSIKRKSASGVEEYALLAASRLQGKTIPARGYFLAAHENSYQGSAMPDVTWATSNSVAADNTVVLYAPDRPEPIDKIGFGTATDYENSAATNPTKSRQTLSRATASDTDNNQLDFILSFPSPRNSSQSAGAFLAPDAWVEVQEPVHAAPTESSTPSSAAIVINEIQLASASTTDEFIELFNPTDAAVDLAGWELKKKTASGNQSNLVDNAVFTGTIPAHGYFLIAHQRGYTGSVTPDLRYSGASYSVADDNTVLLYNSSGALVDKVGLGSAADYEGAATSNPSDGQSIERKPNFGRPRDTDNNQNDFAVRSTPTPKNSLSTTVYPVMQTDQSLVADAGGFWWQRLVRQTGNPSAFYSNCNESTYVCDPLEKLTVIFKITEPINSVRASVLRASCDDERNAITTMKTADVDTSTSSTDEFYVTTFVFSPGATIHSDRCYAFSLETDTSPFDQLIVKGSSSDAYTYGGLIRNFGDVSNVADMYFVVGEL